MAVLTLPLPATAQTAWPRIAEVSPSGAQRGTTVDLTITGVNIGLGSAVLFEGEGLTVEAVTPEKPALPPPPKEGEKPPEPPKNPTGKLVARVRIAPDAAPGVRALRVLTPVGVSECGQFVVGQWPEVAETEPNNARDQAQRVAFPITVTGRVDPGEDVDCFRFSAQAGQSLVFDLLASRLGGPLDSILSLQDAGGREVALNEDYGGKDSLLAFTAPADGDYTLVLRDLSNRGGGDYRYRLSMGAIPYVTGVFPLGGRPGGTVPMELTGFNLGPTTNDQRPTTNDQRSIATSVTLPEADDPALVSIPVAMPGGIGEPRTFALNPAPEVMEAEPNDDPIRAQVVPVPSVVNGRIFVPTNEQRPTALSALRSPLSVGTGQRAESKEQRARASDADCYRFRAEKGQKVILEVIARRCGSQLDSLLEVTDPGGKELVSNDDAAGKDLRLEFEVSEAGEYIARVTDLQEGSGPDYGYRLQISVAAPDFRLSFTPDRLDIPRGERAPMTVTAERLYGFDGEIALEISGLPPGVSIVGPAGYPREAWVIRAGQKEATLVLSATADAPLQSGAPRVSGIATIDSKPIRHAAQGLEEFGKGDEKKTRPGKLIMAAVTEPGDVTLTAVIADQRRIPIRTPNTTNDQRQEPGARSQEPGASVTLAPGGSAEIALKLTRKGPLKGNRPLVVLGLPPGVTADAPEIAEDKSEAKVTLKAEGGAQPVEASIVIMTSVDLGDNRQRFHCAAPITVKVEAKQGGSGG